MKIERYTFGHAWTNSIRIAYDEENDVLEVAGVKYPGALFRFVQKSEKGRWFRIETNNGSDNGELRLVTSDLERAFDSMAGVA